jgi:outer membrane protein assembly factor BamB
MVTKKVACSLAGCFTLLAWLAWCPAASADDSATVPDWPQFHGPNRDAKCAETGLLKEWPEGGPKLLWKLDGLGRGYSTISIVGGKFYTTGDRKTDDGESQFVIAYGLADRKELWATRIGPPHGDGGPRSTPTVDGELLYVVGTDGDLLCVETATGKVRWQKNFARDFGGKMMSVWKFSESPLVDGQKLLCTPGGKDATIAALDKKTGEVIWKCAVPDLGSRGKDGAGYSSMVAAEIEGVRQYVQMLGRGAVGVAADTGKFLWGYNRIANGVANIPTPIVRGNNVFVTTSYQTGSALLKVTRQGDDFKAEEVWFNGPRDFENHHGGVVLVGDHLYGGSGRNQGVPVCLEFATGKIAWKNERAPAGGSAAVLYADGNMVFRYDKGPVCLIEATPKAFRIKGEFTPPVNVGPAWQHPVIHDGKLYIRSHDTLMCYGVRPAEK